MIRVAHAASGDIYQRLAAIAIELERLAMDSERLDALRRRLERERDRLRVELRSLNANPPPRVLA